MSIIDKAKERATQLTQQAKEKVDDIKETRRADSLYAELGHITFRQHTGRAEVGDTTRTSELVNELRTLEANAAANATMSTTGPASEPITTTGTGSVTGTVTTTPTGTPADESHLPPPPTPG